MSRFEPSSSVDPSQLLPKDSGSLVRAAAADSDRTDGADELNEKASGLRHWLPWKRHELDSESMDEAYCMTRVPEPHTLQRAAVSQPPISPQSTADALERVSRSDPTSVAIEPPQATDFAAHARWIAARPELQDSADPDSADPPEFAWT